MTETETRIEVGHRQSTAAMVASGLSGWQLIGAAIGAVLCFNLAWECGAAGIAMVGFVAGVTAMAWAPRLRLAVALTMAIGIACYASQLTFFAGLFKAGAFSLWTILAAWLAAYVATAWQVRRRWPTHGIWLLPVLWTGFEYARCELYPLKFTWLTPGLALHHSFWRGLTVVGVYGVGFFMVLSVVVVIAVWKANRSAVKWMALPVVVALGLLAVPSFVRDQAAYTDSNNKPLPGPGPLVVGIQLEFPVEHELMGALDEALAEHPDAELFVLPEYVLQGAPDVALRDWCREHGVYVVAGGKETVAVAKAAASGAVLVPAATVSSAASTTVSSAALEGGELPLGDKRELRPHEADAEGGEERYWYNTAYVVDPAGEIVFRQVKSVPIQFFNDGQPAPSQSLWQSPWGPIGIGICYDMSYARVMDALVAKGATMLILPTMDVEDWGERQHRLHSMVAPVRAREYGIPIVRVASSGITQLIDARGFVMKKTWFAKQNVRVYWRVNPATGAHLPPDRWLAPVCVAGTVLVIAAFAFAMVAAPKLPSAEELEAKLKAAAQGGGSRGEPGVGGGG